MQCGSPIIGKHGFGPGSSWIEAGSCEISLCRPPLAGFCLTSIHAHQCSFICEKSTCSMTNTSVSPLSGLQPGRRLIAGTQRGRSATRAWLRSTTAAPVRRCWCTTSPAQSPSPRRSTGSKSCRRTRAPTSVSQHALPRCSLRYSLLSVQHFSRPTVLDPILCPRPHWLDVSRHQAGPQQSLEALHLCCEPRQVIEQGNASGYASLGVFAHFRTGAECGLTLCWEILTCESPVGRCLQ